MFRGKQGGTIVQMAAAEPLFDCLDDVVFFVKDRGGRYVVANRTLVVRCGLQHKAELVGRTPGQLFPEPLAARYEAQDRQVIAQGQPLHDRLELHLYPGGSAGWCLTHKFPLHDPAGAVEGIAGLSRDLRLPDRADPLYQRLAETIEYLHEHFDEGLTVANLAERVGLSVAQFARHVRQIFGLTPQQLLIKTRLDAGAYLLARSDDSIAAIAHRCGYADHSAFSRQWKAVVGMTPRQFRALRRTQ